MKVVLVASSSPFNKKIAIKGMDRYIFYLGDNFRKLGHDVKLFVRDDLGQHPTWIKPVYAPKSSWLVYPYFLSKALANVNGDVFHAEYVTSGSALMKQKKTPSVVSIHDVIPFTYDLKKLSLKTRIQTKIYFKWFNSIRNADALIVMSEFSKNQAIKYANVPEEKLHVISNGVDSKFFFPQKKTKHQKIRIGYLGGLDGRKNVELLVKTYADLVEKFDNIELHVGGTGKNLQTFRNMKIRNATFYGVIPENKLNDFYNSLDIFVFPSVYEGFGNMALEAMASGVPLLASNKSSLPEVVGKAGIMVEPDVKSFESALSRLIESSSLRKKLIKRGLERAKLLSWEKCARKTLKVYREVIG